MKKLLKICLPVAIILACSHHHSTEPAPENPATYSVTVNCTISQARMYFNNILYTLNPSDHTNLGNFPPGTYHWIVQYEYYGWRTLDSGDITLDRNRLCNVSRSHVYWQ